MNPEYVREYVKRSGQEIEFANRPKLRFHRIAASILRMRRRSGRKLQKLAWTGTDAQVRAAYIAIG